jgi:hypothetical protein
MHIESKISMREELRLYWEEFVCNSTTHGLINIQHNKTRFFKLMWLMLFLGAFAFCFLLIVKSIDAYLKFEVTTKIRILPKIPMDFPIIKICDANPFSTNYAKTKINEYLNVSGIESPFNLSTSNLKDMKNVLESLIDFLEVKNFHLNDSDKRKLSTELSAVMISCSFGGVPCSADNFTWKHDYNFMIDCYVFNSGEDVNGSQASFISSSQRGILNGFEIELLLPRADDYYLDRANGIRIFIGDSSMEDKEYEEVDVDPGSKMIIGLKKTVSKALPYPYSSCNPDPSHWQYQCIDKCFNSKSYTKCNCSFFDDCFTLEQFKCARGLFYEFHRELILEDECSMKCVSRCELSFYDLSTSSLDYPSTNYAKNLIDNKNIVFKNFDYPIDLDHLKENMIAINVYFKNLEYTLIEESPTTSELDLIANVGGLMGEKFTV